jgi:hypothetical protein
MGDQDIEPIGQDGAGILRLFKALKFFISKGDTQMSKSHKMNLRPIVGAMIMALAAPAAMAAVTPPAANSLPGAFSSNITPTYAAAASNAATITFGTSGPVVLQWGGTALNNTVAAPSGITTNAGFDIGAGASLSIANSSASAASVLINDVTGNPSQIYGTLTAGGASAPTLFVANGNGVIVGSGATLTAPNGIALVGYAQDSAAFISAGGAVVVNGATATNKGDVTVAQGVTGPTGFLLVAGAGNVNVGAAGASNSVLAGYGFTANATGATGGSALYTGSTLNLSGSLNYSANSTVAAAGNVNVLSGANVSMSPAATTSTIIGGAFSNAGNVTLADNLSAGSIVNSGTLTATSSAATLTATGTAGIVNNGIMAGSGAISLAALNTAGAVITNNGVINDKVSGALTLKGSGLVSNNGTINFSGTSGNTVTVSGGSVNFYGAVNQATPTSATPSILNASNAISAASLNATASAGVLNLGTTLFASTASTLAGPAVRVVAGGLTELGGILTVTPGSGKVGSYGYNLSLFPGTTLAAPTINVAGASGSNINLDGVLGNSSTGTVNVNGGTINGSGGFSLASASTLNATFAGNFNNPNGAAAAGHPGVFQYNYVPVNVASNGTAAVNLVPQSTTSTAEMVNLLVNGNVTLSPSGLTAPLLKGGATAVQSSYQNSHLVVQATGNITVSGYWPGLVYLGNINAGTPGSLSRLGTINLGAGGLNNALPANVAGAGGIFFMTSNPLGGLSSTNYVMTNTNSWVNFPASTGFAGAYAANNPSNKYIYGAVINSSTPGVISTQLLPAGDFQGR